MQPAPDPWLVADALLVLAEPAAAKAFARAASGKLAGDLTAFFAAERVGTIDRAARERFAAANAAVIAGEAARGLELLSGGGASGDVIVGIRLCHARGLAQRALGDLPASRDAFLTAARGADAIGWVARAASAYREAGVSAYAAADWSAAEAAWRDRLAIEERRENRAGIADSLGDLGAAFDPVGNYPRALEFYGRALGLKEELRDRRGMAATLGNMAVVHAHTGDFVRALALFERALAIEEEGGDAEEIAVTLANMGTLRLSLGDYARALELHRRSLEVLEAAGNRQAAAVTLGNLGLAHDWLKDYPRALDCYQRALEMKEAVGNRAGMAVTLSNIAGVYHSLRDNAKALEFYERSLALDRELGSEAGVAGTLVNLGVLADDMGDPTKALQRLGEAQELAERLGASDLLLPALWGLAGTHLREGRSSHAAMAARRAVDLLDRISSGLAEEQGSRARERFAEIFTIGARAARAMNDPGLAAFFLERGRSATLLEALEGRDSLRAFVLGEELRREEAQAYALESAARDRVAAALSSGHRADLRAARQELGTAQASLEEVIGKIQRTARSAAGVLYPKSDTLETIQSRLKESEALVLYGDLEEKSGEALALLVLTTTARIVALPEVASIKRACAASDWARVRALAVDPLELPPTTTRLLVSPTGALCTVPFCLLAPDQEIVYIPSATALGVLDGEALLRGDGVLALGDPNYASHAESTELAICRADVTLVPLPASRIEAKAVGDVVLLGSDASKANLHRAISARARWRAVHLACHALILPERPAHSSLALAGGELLTALDVFRSKIPADLVVLSACESAKGRFYRADGTSGFVRAFMLAGAPRVIASLWKVDDEATQACMVAFYKAWRGGAGGAAALRTAQRSVAAQPKWRDARYWAAWQLWGLAD